MIIETDKLKNISQIILAAVDSNELSTITETLEIKVNNNVFYMNVTNREYYAQVRLNIRSDEQLHATVNANVFLKLIQQITTTSVEFNVDSRFLLVKANGTYKLPLIYDDDKLLELPIIKIDNVTSEFNIHGDILNSILQYNSKQLSIGMISKPVQKLYYVDEKGAVTFTSGACVNKFTLEAPVKMLLNKRLVQLFKLFKGEVVNFKIGYDAISDDIIQTKVSFESSDVTVVAILPSDDAMINSVPINAIRGRADTEYPYIVTFNKTSLNETINRLMLFTDTSKDVVANGKFEFTKDKVTISDMNGENKEIINYDNVVENIQEPYIAVLDLNDLKGTLDSCYQQYFTLKFGDSQAVLICRENVVNVVPELHSM